MVGEVSEQQRGPELAAAAGLPLGGGGPGHLVPPQRAPAAAQGAGHRHTQAVQRGDVVRGGLLYHSDLSVAKCTEMEIRPGDFPCCSAGKITRANFYFRTFCDAQVTVYARIIVQILRYRYNSGYILNPTYVRRFDMILGWSSY